MNRKKCFSVFRALAGLAVLLPLLTTGCSRQSGPARYELSGKATYDGKPIPVGEVSFQPDGSKGNSGPGCIALIKNGEYKTEPDKGIVGGPYIVRIAGFDGIPAGDSTEGTALFPQYETRVDLPKQAGTQDFTVPKSPGRPR